MADQKLQRQAADELSRVVMTLVTEEPFFGHLLAGVNRIFTDTSITTMAVGVRTGRVVMFADPEFFMKTLTRHAQRVAVVKHEALHLLLKHLFRTDWARMDRRVANLAADLVVNQFIGSKWELPEGAIRLSTFPTISLDPDQSFEWYYDRLMANADQIPPQLMASHSDHSAWGDFTEVDGVMAGNTLGQHLRRTKERSLRGWTLLDDPLKQIVEATLAELEPTVDWRRVVRMFSNSSRRTRLRNTLRRPSKRYGTYPGLKVKRFHRLAVAVDTSGSISERALSEFFAEIRAIWRQGSEITLVECDQVVQRVSRFGGDIPTSIAGGGGTLFDPVFAWAREQPVPFDGLIYLTDGFAPEPTIQPRERVLWVLTPDGIDTPLTFGRITRIG